MKNASTHSKRVRRVSEPRCYQHEKCLIELGLIDHIKLSLCSDRSEQQVAMSGEKENLRFYKLGKVETNSSIGHSVRKSWVTYNHLTS